jgi:oligopeptide/dipeptide ABC transporter ATP-binding protein
LKEILIVEHLKKYFPIRRGFLNRKVGDIKAVDDVSFGIDAGETFGVVGESGSGKSTLAYVLQGIYAPTGGRIVYDGAEATDTIRSNPKLWSKNVQIVFQNPGSSLNPARSVYQILEVPFHAFKIARSGRDLRKRITELLELVKLPPDYVHKRPSALSGGEKQRVAIARALAVDPSVIILDEPTSALDVSVQAKIVSLLSSLQRDLKITYLFITHDLSLLRNVANRIGVMYLGKICELAPTSELFSDPLHPYAKMLLSSIPVVSDAEEKAKPKKLPSKGEIPSPANVPLGCVFHPRCTEAMGICFEKEPESIHITDHHEVRCHRFN